MQKPTANTFRSWLQIRYSQRRYARYYDWRANDAAADR